jgi:hypothetical protein
MKIVLTQETPHVIFEVQGYAGPNEFNELIAWCHRTDLPEDLSMSFEGTQFRFRSRPERVCWALGFDKAFDLLFDEPQLALWTDYDDAVYVILGNADNRQGLEHFATSLLQELHLARWVEHMDDFKIHASATNVFLMSHAAWKLLSLRQKQTLVARCHGFCEGLAVTAGV